MIGAPSKIWAGAKLPKLVWRSANLPKTLALACPNLQKIYLNVLNKFVQNHKNFAQTQVKFCLIFA